MTMAQVLYFLEVVRLGSISRAAESLFVSQPALSMQIRRLEEELGCALFQRARHGITLTEQGMAFQREAEKVAESWRHFQERTQLLSGTPRERVRIGIGARALSNGIFERVASFFESRPETEVTFLTDISGSTLEALEAGNVHLALDELPRISHPERFFSVELLRERQCVLMARTDPRSGWPEIHFEQLQGGTFISGPEQSPDAALLGDLCRRCGVRMQTVRRSDSVEAMMVLVRSGRGVALGPSSFARRYGVAAVPLLPQMDAPLHLICLRRNSRDPMVVQIEQYLRSCLEE